MQARHRANSYGALPIRAAGDPNLKGADLRVLTIVAYSARFGSNGSGCYMSHENIAKLAGVQRQTASASISRLRSLGYLDALRPHGKKRAQLFVVYDQMARLEEVEGWTVSELSPTDDSCEDETDF